MANRATLPATTRSLLRFNSLESRIVVFFVVLFMVVQLAAFVSIRFALEQSARNNLRQELNVGERIFKRLLEQNSQQLVEATSVLTYDFGFREAIASNDRDTILSALNNHSERINARGMALINLDSKVIADTLNPGNAGKPFAFPELIVEAARIEDPRLRRASGIHAINDDAYQIVVVPVLAPVQISWVAMAFVIDDTLVRVQNITSLNVSFIETHPQKAPRILASTLTPSLRGHLLASITASMPSALASSIANIPAASENSFALNLAGEEFQVLTSMLERHGENTIFAVLQRSTREALESSNRLQVILLFLAGLSLLITLIGSLRIARRITRPVSVLADAAQRLAKGEYRQPVSIQQNDEIGDLAIAFDSMVRGLVERDNMRDLLGKVASPAVAEQLLKQSIELGGEERTVTVMFTDIRNFTTLCEQLSPQQSLSLLNRYLTQMSEVVEEFEGVVDKYTGDGVMALFGAPIGRAGDAERALKAGMEICRRITELGSQLAREGMPAPLVGIGINTSRVIAGNIGSATRLNYTVLGDGVNLASRLESLTKRYRVSIVVGHTTRELVPEIVYRELDKVRVKGRAAPVRIYEPLGFSAEFSPVDAQILDRYHAALDAFRERKWENASAVFTALVTLPGYQHICELYLTYIRQFRAVAPPEDWDGSFTLYEK